MRRNPVTIDRVVLFSRRVCFFAYSAFETLSHWGLCPWIEDEFCFFLLAVDPPVSFFWSFFFSVPMDVF